MIGTIALRNIRAHPIRFLLTLLAVTLGVGFVAGTFSFRAMMSSTFSTLVERAVSADAYVMPHDTGVAGSQASGSFQIPASLAATVETLPDVEHARPTLQGSLVLIGANDLPVGGFGPPSIGFGILADDNAWEFTEGRPPSGDGEIALDAASAANAGLTVGDTTSVVAADGPHEVSVVGIASSGSAHAGATITLLDFDTAARWFGAGDNVGTIAVFAADGVSQQALADALRTVVPSEFDVVTGEQRRADLNSSINQILGFVGTFLLIFAAIALFVGAFIIANTFTMTLRERSRELALLRAVGASPGQIYRSVWLQALVIGLVGSLLGVAVGYGLVVGIRALMTRFGMDLSGEIPIQASTVVVSVLVGVLVCVVASALPARKAAITPPVDAMRTDEVASERPLRVRGAVGLAMLVAGVVAVVLSVRHVWPAQDGLLGAGAGLILVGALAFAPIIGKAVLGLLAAVPAALAKPMGKLARGNVTRHPRRTANTAGALMIGMALVGASATLAASTNASTADLVREEIKADLMYQSLTLPMPAALLTDTAALANVEYVDSYAFSPVQVDGADQILYGQTVHALTVPMNITVHEGSVSDMGEGTILISKSAADGGLSMGDTVTVTGPAGALDLRVVGVVDAQTMGGWGYVTPETMALLNPAPRSMFAMVGVAPGSLDSVRTAMEDLARPYQVVNVLDGEGFTSFVAQQVNQILAIMYGLLGLSVIIAVLGIINTLALSVMERTREIGLLRAVGLGRLQTAATISIESVLIAVFGTVLGLAVGVGLAAAVQQVYSSQGLSVLAIPWAQLGVMTGLAVVVGLIASIWPAVRAARLPVLEAVTVE